MRNISHDNIEEESGTGAFRLLSGPAKRSRAGSPTYANGKAGFTLIELLVVIGIAVLLMAIVVPVGKGLRESNAAMSCQAQLQHIGTALKAYYMDEQGLPPLGVPVDGSGNPTSDAEINTSRWPGLMVLYDTEYIGNIETLHCPRDVYAEKGGADYYHSYTDKDPLAKVDYGGSDINVNKYKYMPHRWVTDTDFGDYRRQLDTAASDIVEIGGDDFKIVGPSGVTIPTDSTIVTWCDAHYDSYTRDDYGQYMVLFWDGTVKSLDGDLFRDDTVGPDAAWQVGPNDTAH